MSPEAPQNQTSSVRIMVMNYVEWFALLNGIRTWMSNMLNEEVSLSGLFDAR
jgi:hypothetical protein